MTVLDTRPLPGTLGESRQRPTVLAVDDTPANLSLLSQLLGRQYRVQIAVSGAKALELMQKRAPDMVLLDVMMPGMDGYEVCRRMKADPRTRDVPVIFLTALNGVDDETRGFDVGGADFVTKPFNPATLQARVHTQLELKAWRDALRDRNKWLQVELDARLQDLNKLQVDLDSRLVEVEKLRETTLFVMVSLAEFRDEDTGNHIKRTQEYVAALAEWLVAQGLAPAWLDGENLQALVKAAPLHDIGKIGIPDRVLLKPGPLTAEEWLVMQSHTRLGAELLQRAAEKMGDRAGPMLRHAMDIASHHHEKWDGSGYPAGLAGQAIPLSARLMAVADVYDALISRRVYKEAMSHEQALAWITDNAGKHFDPLLVRALQATQARVLAIAQQWRD